MNVCIEHGIQGATRAVERKDSIVIVDTIRASTTYVNAFGSGIERIVPCASMEDLILRLKKYPNSVKSGERQCRKIEGYEYGSSPKEMSVTDLTGKTMLSSTTNGSRMVVASNGSPCVVMGSFCNATAVGEVFSKLYTYYDDMYTFKMTYMCTFTVCSLDELQYTQNRH